MHPRINKSLSWLGTDTHKTYAACYGPSHHTASSTGIVICPTVGHEYVHNHRIHCYLAEQLALYTNSYCVRLDFWGSGDSPTTHVDTDYLIRWASDIQNCIDYLENQKAVKHICLVGFRFGAFIVSQCLARLKTKTHIRKVILWSPYQQGAAFLRDMELISSRQSTWQANNEKVDLGGILFSKKAVETLRMEKIQGEGLPKIPEICILQAENERPNKRLAANLGACSESVELISFTGYSNMMKPGLLSIISQDAVAKITNVIGKCSPYVEAEQATIALNTQEKSRFQVEATVTETLFSTGNGCTGILSMPAEPRAVTSEKVIVFLNGGAAHHSGPGRMYTNITREMSSRGIPCARVDISNLGDGSDVCNNIDKPLHPFPDSYIEDIHAVLGFLKENFSFSKFALGGLCSAGHNAYHYSLKYSEGLKEVIFINPMHFYWREGLSVVPHIEETNSPSIRNLVHTLPQQRGLKFISHLFNILKGLIGRIHNSISQSVIWNTCHPPGNTQMIKDLNKLEKQNIRCLMLFSEGEPANVYLGKALGWKLKGYIKRNTIEIIELPRGDHAFLLHNQQKPLCDSLLEVVQVQETTKRIASSRFNA